MLVCIMSLSVLCEVYVHVEMAQYVSRTVFGHAFLCGDKLSIEHVS